MPRAESAINFVALDVKPSSYNGDPLSIMALLLVTAPLPPAPAGGDYGWAVWSTDGRKLRSEGSAPPALLPSGDEVNSVAARVADAGGAQPEPVDGGVLVRDPAQNGLLITTA